MADNTIIAIMVSSQSALFEIVSYMLQSGEFITQIHVITAKKSERSTISTAWAILGALCSGRCQISLEKKSAI